MKKIYILLAALICCFTTTESFAQCAAGQTQITIDFSGGGGFPAEISWELLDGATQLAGAACGTFVGDGTADDITLCVTDGAALTFNAFDDWGDGWNGENVEIIISEDGSVNGCAAQTGCVALAAPSPTNGVAGDGTDVCDASDLELTVALTFACDATAISGCTDLTAVNFNACATADDGSCVFPVTNDECAGAIDINAQVNTDGSCTLSIPFNYDATVTNSAGEIPPAGDCADGSVTPLDVWFTFTATEAIYDITMISNGSGFSSHFDLYEGACGALTQTIACVPNLADGAVAQWTGLTVGTQYFIRYWDFGSDQLDPSEFCLNANGGPPCSSTSASTGPAGDVCSGEAFDIILGNCTDGSAQDGFLLVYDTDPTTVPTDQEVYDALTGGAADPGDIAFLGDQTTGCVDFTGLTVFNNGCDPLSVAPIIVPADVTGGYIDATCPVEILPAFNILPAPGVPAVSVTGCVFTFTAACPNDVIAITGGYGTSVDGNIATYEPTDGAAATINLSVSNGTTGTNGACAATDLAFDVPFPEPVLTCPATASCGVAETLSSDTPPGDFGVLVIDINGDDFTGTESSLDIVDANGNIIESFAVGSITPLDLTTLISVVPLADGPFTVNLNDTFGDGISGTDCGFGTTPGDFTISDGAGNVLVATHTPGSPYAVGIANIVGDCGSDTQIIYSGLTPALAFTTTAMWSGTGVTDNGDGTASFQMGMNGTYTATYEYNDENGCTSTTTCDIEITDCVAACTATAPAISTTDPTTICVDGTGDPINVAIDTPGGATDNAWVITDANGIILDLPAGPPFDLDGAGPGVCLIWYLNFDSNDFAGAAVGADATVDLTGCYALSNPITVTRNEVTASTISIGGATSATLCIGTGDTFDIDVDVAGSGPDVAYVITDAAGIILDFPAGTTGIDLNGAPAGTCLFWIVDHDGSLGGAAVGADASTDLTGCYALSNPVSIDRFDPTADDIFAATACEGDGTSYTAADGTVYDETNPTSGGPVTVQDANGCDYVIDVALTFEDCTTATIETNPSIADPCDCTDPNNIDLDGDGAPDIFFETVVITSDAGETWADDGTSTGILDAAGNAAAASFTEATDAYGVTTYTANFYHAPPAGYSGSFSNGTETLTATNVCSACCVAPSAGSFDCD